MRINTKVVGVVASMVFSCATPHALADKEMSVEEAIENRIASFEEIGKDMKTLALMAQSSSGESINKTDFYRVSEHLHRESKKPWGFFIKNSFYGNHYGIKTGASPEIYKNEMFNKSVVRYLTEVGVLQQLAKNKESSSVLRSQLIRVSESCQSCHDTYYTGKERN